MPGGGRSESTAVRTIGALVALLAVVGSLAFEWSFTSPGGAIPTAIGLVVAVSAIGWTPDSRVRGA